MSASGAEASQEYYREPVRLDNLIIDTITGPSGPIGITYDFKDSGRSCTVRQKGDVILTGISPLPAMPPLPLNQISVAGRDVEVKILIGQGKQRQASCQYTISGDGKAPQLYIVSLNDRGYYPEVRLELFEPVAQTRSVAEINLLTGHAVQQFWQNGNPLRPYGSIVYSHGDKLLRRPQDTRPVFLRWQMWKGPRSGYHRLIP